MKNFATYLKGSIVVMLLFCLVALTTTEASAQQAKISDKADKALVEKKKLMLEKMRANFQSNKKAIKNGKRLKSVTASKKRGEAVRPKGK